ncbi:PP2C family protein-serine/threonine phosphatase [Streptomyces sp. NEAU-Y11]|uniref:PP2C family protein-serine/threonine phosphatase n=1 Tax=Streptomyces cucumeris TaxID=2962890 RepID=UPI0020C8AA12|nr:PP2C family protein-serine/threonine phosphatase [Streptomyces sp. NEAU-Y11]MCP9212081.1 serine/threonine-protein phosphatase [Streptomyces sp. NEAU-Y11]
MQESAASPAAAAMARVWLHRLTPLSPFALIAVIALVEAVTPDWLRLGPVLAAASVLAAAICGLGVTAAVAATTMGVNALLDLFDGRWGSSASQIINIALLAVGLASLLACSIRQRRERELTQVRSVAETAQRTLIRPLPARLDSVLLKGTYIAAESEARIGGDFYEVLHTPHGVRLLIGDVRGKGLPAVDASAALLGAFREAAHHEPCLADVARWLEGSAHRNIRRLYGEEFTERFATALLVEIPEGSVARLVHCGHPHPLAIRDGDVHGWEAPEPGPPIGLAELVEGGPSVQTVPFRGGDRLLLFTDGVIEARDGAGRFYPLPERMARWREDPLDRLVDQVRADLRRHAGGDLDDDAALLAIERLPL